MHYLQIPHAIEVTDRKTGGKQTIPFRDFALTLWLNDSRWEKPRTNLARLGIIAPEFDKSAGEWIALEDQDYAILKSIIETPGTGPTGEPLLYVPLIHLQLTPFEKAVLDAPTTDPRISLTNGSKLPHPEKGMVQP